MELTEPAKINLYLKVLSKREDGYHEIETMFEKVSILDSISVEVTSETTSITCDDPEIPTGKTSLLGKTISEFQKKTSGNTNFKVHLKKNIPVAAGLGGGSSDAAALLKGLNSLSGQTLSNKELMEIAGILGADVPFFMTEYSFARGTGRGDVIRGIENPGEIWHIVVNPPFEVSTREVYGKLESFGLTNDIGVDRMVSTFSRGKHLDSIVQNLCNDLQSIVLRDFPELHQVFSKLDENGAKGVLLSGSGPSVFGIFNKEDIPEAEKNLRQAFTEEKGWHVFVAKTY